MAAAGSIRLKVLIGIAAAIGVYVVATGNEGSVPEVVAAEPAKSARLASAETPDDETQMLSHTAGRNVSSSAGTLSADSAAALLVRLKHRANDPGDSGSLFQRHTWYVPPPPPPPPPPVKVAEAPPPAPTAPPLPFGVMGSYARPGDPTVYFLTRGDRVFDVRVGDTIDGTYKVESDSGGRLTLVYKPLNIPQTIALGASQ